MMGDSIEASLFKLLLPAIRAKKLIEVDVFTGYTTLIMAEAIGPDGKIVALAVSENTPKLENRTGNKRKYRNVSI
jgi:caffeoyl-CoA O-methyltransferase